MLFFVVLGGEEGGDILFCRLEARGGQLIRLDVFFSVVKGKKGKRWFRKG